MSYINILLILTLGLAACTPPPDGLLIENVTIVSAHLDAPSTPQNVLIRDGVIAEISVEPITAGRRAHRIDASGRFLTPGLMDSHHHVAFVPGMGAMGVTPATDYPALVEAYMAQQPLSLLYFGVTQILDPAPLLAWTEFEAAPLAPDLMRCGEIPNAAEGYPLNQREDGDALVLYPYRIEGDATPETVVARIAADGGICVKIYLEDGFGAATGWPLFDAALLARIRDAAHAHGLPVIVHANAIDMYQIALDARLDILGHGLWNWQWPEGEPPVAATLDRLVEQGTGYMPTHGVMAGLGDQLRAGALDDPRLADVVPAALLDWYRTGEGQWFADELAADFPPGMPREEMADIFGYGVGRAQRATAYLHGQGHPLLLTSDCPGSPTFVNQPGLCTWREILSLAEAGVSLQAILEAGTINPARQFGLEAEYGTVEAGKIANLLILSANPLEDVTAWDRIETIVLHGEAISRETLAVQ